MISLALSLLFTCAPNNVNVSNKCQQLYKDAIGVYYNLSSVKKYVMCYQNYVLSKQLCLLIQKQDTNVNRVVTTFSAITKSKKICTNCQPGYVLDYNTQVCVIQKVIVFTQITCNGYITVSSDLAGNNFDQISLCSLSSDSSVASNSIINFETTVPVSQSTAIGLFSLTTVFSNILVKGVLTVKQSRSQSQIFIGTLTGLMNQNTFIQNCTIDIRLKLDSASTSTVFKSGGLVGMIQGKFTLQVLNCTVKVQVDLTKQGDNTGKSWYSVSGGIVGHLHLVPTLQIDNTNTTLNMQTTRAAGGFLGILQGGIVLITNSISRGTAYAYSCGGMLGEAGAPGLTPTQTQQVTLDSVRSEMQMSGSLNGVIIGQGCKKTVIQFVGTNTYATNGVCITGNANGLTFSGTTGC
ncbi:Hypothetical_protein [Hexamita inflata]|uniref:Hypothetical_protein n=1 Tax=Hexamita inflata TaxID=28002 RepID=A0AA86UKK8_9EUKA|nr:Hypothetical protein HINF_LOCUS42781 [Hexamita inflata]